MTSKKTKTVTKTKTTKPTPRPEPMPADGTPLRETSARFRKLIAGTAVEPAATAEPTTADAPVAAEATPPAAKAPRTRKVTPTAAPAAPAAPDAPLGATALKTIGGAYVAHLQATGKSLSTIASYAADLTCAYDHFGAARDATTITPAEIAGFDESDVVLKKKSGAGRAKPTILKTRRVLRLALTWAAETGLVATAPYAAKAAS